MSDKDLDELKKKKMEELQKQSQGEAAQAQQEEQMREKLKALASQILTEDARSRLNNIRVAKPELASQIELQLVRLHQAGQIQEKITDDQLKKMLKSLQSSGKDRNIKHR